MATYPAIAPVMVAHHPSIMIFRELPVRMQCHYCHAEIATTVTYEAGTLTYLIAIFLFVLGLWLGCCLIPFCIDGCKDCVHTCPNCYQVLGRFNRM